MLGAGVEVEGQVADVLAAVGDEGDGLVGLHTLAFEHLEEAPFGFGVVGLHEAEGLGLPVGGHGLAGDHLKPAIGS